MAKEIYPAKKLLLGNTFKLHRLDVVTANRKGFGENLLFAKLRASAGDLTDGKVGSRRSSQAVDTGNMLVFIRSGNARPAPHLHH